MPEIRKRRRAGKANWAQELEFTRSKCKSLTNCKAVKNGKGVFQQAVINPATFSVGLISGAWMQHWRPKAPRARLKQADPGICARFSGAKTQ